MSFHEGDLGFSLQEQQYLVFFGKKQSDFENLNKKFPSFQFIRMKQIHSDIFYEAKTGDDLKFEADAIFTSEKNLALCCSTADCMPILVYSPEQQIAFSIHAGWRGVANHIVAKTLAQYVDPKLKIYIGPHIGLQSFEVENNVRDQILTGRKNQERFISKQTENKCHVDLTAVVVDQIHELNIPLSQISRLKMDTKTNEKFHSFRRDQLKSGRQISFIVMK